MKIGLIVAFLLATLATPAAFAEKANRQRLAATTDLVSRDQDLGKSHTVRAEDLPAPRATQPVSNAPLTLPFDGQAPGYLTALPPPYLPNCSIRAGCWCCRTAMSLLPSKSPVT
jgi:hypothetical protein